MPKYLLKGGTIIWPLLLNSVVARSCFSLLERYGPTVGVYPGGQIEAEVEALMWVIVNLVHGNSLSGAGLPLGKRPEREAEALIDPPDLFQASRERSLTWDQRRKTVFA